MLYYGTSLETDSAQLQESSSGIIRRHRLLVVDGAVDALH